MMDAEEREIYFYLKSWRSEYVSAREICRRAGGKKKFRSNEEWAKPVLVRMAEKGIVENDTAGHYRLKPMDKSHRKDKKWVSPHIARILKDSGKDFDHVVMEEDEMDRYYEGLS